MPDGDVRVAVLGDSAVVVGWWNGDLAVGARFRSVVEKVWSLFHAWWGRRILSCSPHHPFCFHIFREVNKLADSLATRAMERGRSWQKTVLPSFAPQIIRIHTDGGCRNDIGGCGYTIEVARAGLNLCAQSSWQFICKVSLWLGKCDSITAELIGSKEACRACDCLLNSGVLRFDDYGLVDFPTLEGITQSLAPDCVCANARMCARASA